jgi:predicted transcriptional regulator
MADKSNQDVLVETRDQMEVQMEDMKENLEKFLIKGNNAAGARARKAAQEISKSCKTVRALVSEIKNEK